MERKKAFLVGTVLLAAGLGFVLFHLLTKSSLGFQRLKPTWTADPHFQFNRETSRLEFIRNGERIRVPAVSSNDIHPFFLRNETILPIEWRISGKTGFFSDIYFESLNPPGKIRFSLIRQRGRHQQDLEYVEAEKVDYSLFKQIDLRKGDKLFFQFQGYGIAYVSHPIQYRIRPPKQQKLVILIGVDTLRADFIGRRVNGRPLTPHLDRFAADGVRFNRAYAQSSWTIPSFASMFSGLYGDHHRVSIHTPLSWDKPHLVNPLRNRFLTFGIHGGLGLDPRWGFARNYDHYRELPQTGPLFPRGGESLFEKAMEVIDQGRFPSLFLFLHTYQVHAPYTPPEEYLSAIAGPDFPEKDLDVVNSSKPKLTYMPVADAKRSALEMLYAAEVHAFDAFFGRFLTKLKKAGLYQQAMIIVFGDHGEEFYEHGGWAHSHSLYEELIRVPLIWKFPGSEFAGRTVTGLTGLIDVLPTVLDIWDIERDPRLPIDGVSLMPLVRQGWDVRPVLVASNSYCRYIDAIPPRFALLRDSWKLIWNSPFSPTDLAFFSEGGKPPLTPEHELFDLKSDLAERRNLAVTDPSRIQPWKALILEWMKKVEGAKKSGKSSLKEGAEESLGKLRSLGYI